MSNKPMVVYLAARGFERDLLDELALNGVHVREVKERLVLADGLFRSAWAQNIWLEPFFQPIASEISARVITLLSLEGESKPIICNSCTADLASKYLKNEKENA